MSGLAVLILVTLARIFMPSAIMILLLRFMTIATVLLSTSSTMVLDSNPRDMGSKKLVIYCTSKNRSDKGKVLNEFNTFPVDGKICQVRNGMILRIFYC